MAYPVTGQGAGTATADGVARPGEGAVVRLHVGSEVHQPGSINQLSADLVRGRVEPEMALGADCLPCSVARLVDVGPRRTVVC